MINFLLYQYLIYYFDNEEYKKNESIKRILDYCKENKSLYYDKNKLLLAIKRKKNELILMSDVEFYKLTYHNFSEKLLLRIIKKNNIMLVDNVSIKENYYKNNCNSFLLESKYLKFYRYLKLKITIYLESYFTNKIIKNMTNLIIDLHISDKYNKNKNINNLVSNYLPSSIKILQIDNLEKFKQNLPNKIILIINTNFRTIKKIKTRVVTLFLHCKYIYTNNYDNIVSSNLYNDIKNNNYITTDFNEINIKEDYKNSY